MAASKDRESDSYYDDEAPVTGGSPKETQAGWLMNASRTPSDTAVGTSEPQRRRPVIITLDGRRVSERFILTREESILGRDVHADIIICDGEVSRRHARICWLNLQDGGPITPACRLEDMESTNGTFLNGKRLREPHLLMDGDHIRIGKTLLGFFLKNERVLELDQLLLTMALHDSLTGVYKREYLFSELHREFERSKRHGRPLSLLMLDVDHFKQINDSYGHLRGDEALRQIANLLRLSLREGDICGRFGGEEFSIVLPETDEVGAKQAAERIRTKVEKHKFNLADDLTVQITVSVGVSTMGSTHTDKLQLVDDADKAMYIAKQSGRNRTILASEYASDQRTKQVPQTS
ncbi:diguanylate cyclase [Candidatus Poribacteria bacterium]|nr:diguanylate cyclase [Candidatus Poribacteria bacterium]